jgi:hypothetical protein
MEDLAKEFHKLILQESAGNSNINEKAILSVYHSILKSWIDDYELYRKFVPYLLNTLEKYPDTAFPYSLKIYFDLYERVLTLSVKRKFDPSIVDIVPQQSALNNFRRVLELKKEENSHLRISELTVDENPLTPKETKEIISLLINKLNSDSTQLIWDLKETGSTGFELAYLRAFCVSINEAELFYHAANIFLDRLFTSGLLQQARDLCEELLIASFKDKMNFYGYFMCFRVYSNQGNSQAAALYGNLFLNAVNTSNSISSTRFLFEIIWQTLKFFRNSHLPHFAIQIYKAIPKHFQFTTYERLSLDCTYFTCCFNLKDESLPHSLSDFLDKERENILEGAEEGCMPWLLMLYNIQRIRGEDFFNKSGLQSYLTLFESIVQKDLLEKQKNIIFGLSEPLKDQLKESLLKLIKTRNKEDFGYDNEMAVTIASRLVEDSFQKQDIEAILLSMMIKSDYSLVFLEQENPGLTPLDSSKVQTDSFYEIFPDPRKSVEKFPLGVRDCLICLVNTESKLYQLSYFQKTFQLYQLKTFDKNRFDQFSDDLNKIMIFDTSVKDRNGKVRSYLKEDYEDQANIISKQISFPQLQLSGGLEKILLVKDMAVSEFPHNLLLDDKGDFVALNTNVANILSIEWLNENLGKEANNLIHDKSIFIPIDGGDFTITMLFESIKDVLQKNKFNVEGALSKFKPINSTLNIIASHGSEEISKTEMIYPNSTNVIHNINGILGSGKILVLLVCHSGSMRELYYKNEIASIVKKYLSRGYQTVIAPFWALHISIPKIWLPAFLDEINKGEEISKAVLTANKMVYNSYQTPAAWACMHFYGNPYFKLDLNN